MNVYFFNENSENEIISFEEHPVNNRIPRMGETVVINNEWYCVEKVLTEYKRLKTDVFCTVSVWIKILEEEK